MKNIPLSKIEHYLKVRKNIVKKSIPHEDKRLKRNKKNRKPQILIMNEQKQQTFIHKFQNGITGTIIGTIIVDYSKPRINVHSSYNEMLPDNKESMEEYKQWRDLVIEIMVDSCSPEQLLLISKAEFDWEY